MCIKIAHKYINRHSSHTRAAHTAQYDTQVGITHTHTHTRTQTKHQASHALIQTRTHTQLSVCMYNIKSSCNMWNYTLSLPPHTHTHTHTLNTQPKCHAPFGLWSGERSEQPANIESIYFFSAHERDVIPPKYI